MFFRRSSLTLFPLAARTRVCRTFPTWAGWWTYYSTVCTFIRTFDTLGSGGRVDMRGQAGWPRTFPPQFDSKGKIRPKRVFVFYQPAIIKKVSRSILYIWQLCLRPVTPPSGRWWVVRPLSTKKRRSETPLFSSRRDKAKGRRRVPFLGVLYSVPFHSAAWHCRVWGGGWVWKHYTAD